MSNVLGIAWRAPCPGLRASSLFLSVSPKPLPLASYLTSSLRPSSSRHRNLLSARSFCFLRDASALRHSRNPLVFSPVPTRSFQTSAPLRSSKPPAVDHGVKPRPEPFSLADINAIFGARAKVSQSMGNRVLAVLHGRRLNGTLDLDLPVDISRSVRPHSLDAALSYLREHYPMDEDAAIMARIEREELEEEQKLIRRAEELGLYKPQSGQYEAELGENKDVSGKSVFQEMRKRNEERLLAEDEQKRKEWLEGAAQDQEKYKQMRERNTALQKVEDTSALELRERADPRERPLLAWVQKHHLRAMETDVDVTKMTTSRRIVPSLIFSLVALGLCYAFAVFYEPPARADRLWPDTPRAAATLMGIIGINVGIFALWRAWPPSWRLLNRYFISVAAYPRPFSIIGNVFSHQKPLHLSVNMVMLWFVGTRLHDEVGRGEFLSLYMASGIVGSLLSLSAHVLLGQWTVTALGASGAISGIVAGWCILHANDNLTFYLLPEDWQGVVSARGWFILSTIVAAEVVRLAMTFRAPALDHWAHIGGYITGIIWASFKNAKEKKRREEMSWFQRLFSN
ncbi:rhomboid protease PCP1 [Aspergillus brunneoviolaceus CBS 621.78]|uniref:Rhomboid-domain-containing protein n=1 Tax=Aspergillus brunneoviolaceus CBS 621.78 TaxID=1450534 RepID=A0ACD1GNX1_9EURO|nr:rhomboid-domain-containing protein [Aspergillus brunneoviolaceus CBS 621.78]RAH50937.1 rhomboid-domain-containing protein [Aspergillus brunneoviolaceus CBS 621.78]